MTAITCPNPSCRTVTVFPDDFDVFQRSSEEFCPQCDTPLFWSPNDEVLASLAPGSDKTRRRLPGAGPTGLAALGSRACPVCSERNTLKAVYCYRCGAEMVPRVVLPPPPPPEIIPEVIPPPLDLEPVPNPRDFTWIIVGLTAIMMAVILLTTFN